MTPMTAPNLSMNGGPGRRCTVAAMNELSNRFEEMSALIRWPAMIATFAAAVPAGFYLGHLTERVLFDALDLGVRNPFIEYVMISAGLGAIAMAVVCWKHRRRWTASLFSGLGTGTTLIGGFTLMLSQCLPSC